MAEEEKGCDRGDGAALDRSNTRTADSNFIKTEVIWWKHFPAQNLAAASRLTALGKAAYYILQDAARCRSPLPKEDERLAALVGISVKQFRAVKAEALEDFFKCDDTGWWSERIETERIEAQELREKNRQRTKAATEAARLKRLAGGGE